MPIPPGSNVDQQAIRTLLMTTKTYLRMYHNEYRLWYSKLNNAWVVDQGAKGFDPPNTFADFEDAWEKFVAIVEWRG